MGADNVRNTPDDTVDTDGLAARLLVLGKRACDSATGMITSMADGQDGRVRDLKKQVDNWDLRLRQRQDALTGRFKAMESALGRLKSQSAWLSSQIDSLYNPNARK